MRAPRIDRVRAGRAVVLVAVLTALLRLPYVAAPMSSDEAGFLIVGGQWTGAGPSLYGHYWVDRPPLLIALFGLADRLGGLGALRLMGCLAVLVTVLGVGLALRAAAGARAATWGALTAGALLVSPLTGAVPVNGELLAAPFIALGVWAAVEAARAGVPSHAARWAVLSGGCAVAALLVKQNMLDVAVFALALGLVGLRTGHTSPSALVRGGAAFAAGGAVVGGAALAVAAVLGTGPGRILFALYTFRVRALDTLEYVPLAHRLQRLLTLGGRELLSMAPLVVLGLLVVVVARRRARSLEWSVAVATLAMAAYAVASVMAGGSFWSHYLVELVVPVSMAAGLLVEASFVRGRMVVALVVLSSTIAWGVGLTHEVATPGAAAGRAIARVAAPGDTIVSVFGEAEVVASAGLRSPYPYLWALPARTLDGRFHALATLLESPRRPTWFVVRGPETTRFLGRGRVGIALRLHYRRVVEVCGRGIYLRDDTPRPAPVPGGGCTQPMSSWFDADHAPAGGVR